MKLVAWKYFLVMMALMLSVGASVVALTPVPVKAETPPIAQWVQMYGFSGHDSDAKAIAVDGSGNVYVTGYSDNGTGTGNDYATIKYNALGVQQWDARYNGLADSDDIATAIAVDSSGNVYVTGQSRNLLSIDEYATVKYDTLGVQQWVSSYGVPGGNSDAVAIALDGNGNAYVTGSSNDGNSLDWATVKYSSTGGQQWVMRYDGPAHYFDAAWAIAVDSAGNAYVTGSSRNIHGNDEYATVKYDTSGVLQWVSAYNGPGNSGNAEAVAVDGSGNAYVTGLSYNASNSDYATIKYNSDGVQQWVMRYDNGGDDRAQAIAVDSSGNAYVTGYSYGCNWDYATIKYDALGVQQWAARYNITPGCNWAEAVAIALDGSGNAYVTGRSYFHNYDYATVKYSSTSGAEMWVMRYTTGASDFANAIALDASNNCYVTGYMNSGSNNEYATFKYVQQAAPTVRTDNATSVMATTAILHGSLTSTGGAPTTVVVYSGTTDGVTTPGIWARSDNLSINAAGLFSLGVTGLSPSTPYYYRCYAENSAGGSWASESASFITQANLGLWRNYWEGPGKDWHWFSSGGP